MLFICSSNPGTGTQDSAGCFPGMWPLIWPDLAWTQQPRLLLPAAQEIDSKRKKKTLKVSPLVSYCVMLTTGRKLIWHLSFSETWRNLWALALQTGKIIWFSKWETAALWLWGDLNKNGYKKDLKCETQHIRVLNYKYMRVNDVMSVWIFNGYKKMLQSRPGRSHGWGFISISALTVDVVILSPWR